MNLAIEQLDWSKIRKPYKRSLAELELAEEMIFSPEMDELEGYDGDLDSIEKDLDLAPDEW